MFFFPRDALKEQFGKEPNRVSCLAVKSALLALKSALLAFFERSLLPGTPFQQRGATYQTYLEGRGGEYIHT